MNKEFWKVKSEVSAGVEGWLSDPEAEFLYNQAKNLKGKGVVVEIGSWKGKSTIYLAKALRVGAHSPIYAIDPHTGSYVHRDFQEEDTFDEFLRNIRQAGVGDIVHPIRKTSEEAVKDWLEPIELLWIDGDHRYEMVKKDFELWWPHLVEGGLIAFHDSTYDDVQRLICQILRQGNFADVGLVDSITHARKLTGARIDFRTRYIIWLNTSQNALRKIPLPAFVRTPIRNAVKKFIRFAQ